MQPDDDDPTPRREQPAPLHLPDESWDPARELSTGLTDSERDLCRALDRDPDRPAPYAHVAKLAKRAQKADEFAKDTVAAIGDLAKVADPKLGRRVTALERTFAKVQKLAWAALLAVVGGLGSAAVYVQKRAHDSGAAEQVIIDLQKTVDRISDDIREIRAELGRRSQATSHAVKSGSMPAAVLTP